MSYSYSNPVVYGPQATNPYYDMPNNQKPSSLGVAIVGGVAGAGIGATIGGVENFYLSKKGNITDSFTKKVFETQIKNATGKAKTAYEGGLNILEKIDKVKNVDELKTLFNSNKIAAEEICTELRQTPDEFLKFVNSDNLKNNISTIKEKIKAGNNTRYQNVKNQIQACWDAEKKQFVKNNSIDENIYNAIKKVNLNYNLKNIAKHAGIGTAFAALTAFIVYKLSNR